jgi:hypothetical protein
MSRVLRVLQTHRSAAVTAGITLSLLMVAVGVRAFVASRSGNSAEVAITGEVEDGGALDAVVVPDAGQSSVGSGSGTGGTNASQGSGSGGGQKGAGGGRAGRAGTATQIAGGADAGDTGSVGGRSPSLAAAGGTPLPGVTDDEITVVYYWKGDRTRTSPYLRGSGAEANVDEAEAFRQLIDYVNSHADGGGTIMGFPFDLHGRRLKGVVVDAGQDPESYAAAAETITAELKPFAALAAHGSISTYLCPALAKAGIHNFATYDLGGGLAERTGGYCLPGSITWERQVAMTQAYLLRQQRAEPDRVYGVVYTEYPGLVDSAPVMIERFKEGGVKIAETASVSASLSTAQQQAPNVVARLRAAGVNTIVMPDAGAPLNFTHAAQAQGYNPDYYVWPCSGQDTLAMARLFNATQWHGAEGLTCYDEQFSSDLTHNANTRSTEWYAAYQDAAPGQEPPSPTPFVYASLLPLVAGITDAGPHLTLETFRAALSAFPAYRYDAVDGRTTDPSNMLLGLGRSDRSFTSDVAKLRFDAGSRQPGAATPGAYTFPERRRYATPAAL